MSFKTTIAADVNAVFFNTSEFASAGLFSQFNTSVTIASVPVIITIGAEGNRGYGVAEVSTLSMPRAIFTNASITPTRNDSVTIGTTIYTLLEKISSDDDAYLFTVESEERHNPK